MSFIGKQVRLDLPKKWMKFATKGDPRFTQKMNEVYWQTSEVRLTQKVDEVCNRFLLSSIRTRKTPRIF
jgi:hypothetical protein